MLRSALAASILAAQILAETSARFNTEVPELHIVSPDHELLEGIRYARAVVYDSGREALYLASDQTEDPERLLIVIEHEISHFAAWQKHGHNIPEHGTKWRAICRANASDLKACEY